MKRKLDAEDIPTAISSPVQAKPSDAEPSFGTLGLDPRLLQAIAKEGFPKSTPVQAKAIPLALEGKDVIGMSLQDLFSFFVLLTYAARARTGSGKTAAYVLPILESILRQKNVRPCPFQNNRQIPNSVDRKPPTSGR